MLFERGIVMSYETIRQWGRKFGPNYDRGPSQAAKPHDVWYLDEVVISIAGKKHWLWRAVDQDDLSWRYECLDIHKQRETGPGPSLCNRPGDQSGGRFPASVRSSEATP